MKTLVSLLIMIGLHENLAQEQSTPRFITGLDDIPLLEDLEPVQEPVIFDKPLGTVARLNLTGSKNAPYYIERYEEALSTFGWQCGPRIKPIRLTCLKDGNAKHLSVQARKEDDAKTLVILKIDPVTP